VADRRPADHETKDDEEQAENKFEIEFMVESAEVGALVDRTPDERDPCEPQSELVGQTVQGYGPNLMSNRTSRDDRGAAT